MSKKPGGPRRRVLDGLLSAIRFLPANWDKKTLSALSVTTYDFRTAMKRVGPSIRR